MGQFTTDDHVGLFRSTAFKAEMARGQDGAARHHGFGLHFQLNKGLLFASAHILFELKKDGKSEVGGKKVSRWLFVRVQLDLGLCQCHQGQEQWHR
jgi:hypothetical protein